MRALWLTFGLTLVAGPAIAQQATRPEGWNVRFDRPGQPDSAIAFTDMPPGWHVTTGPAAILYDPATTAAGTFAIESEMYLFPDAGTREAYGVIFGGRNLDGPDQQYLYFLVRGDGSFIVKHRDGGSAETLVPWTQHDAVAAKLSDENAKNVLRVEVRESEISFFVNGTQVTSLAREGLDCDGIVGLRVNHRINLHVTSLDVTS